MEGDRRVGKGAELLRCPDCDLLQRRHPLEQGQKAHCPRCRVLLYRAPHDAMTHTLALTLAALALWLVANLTPFMTFAFKGRSQDNLVISGVLGLWADGELALASLIFFASIAAPLVYFVLMLGVLVPLRLGRIPPGVGLWFRAIKQLRPWSMIEVYMLGVMVAVVKLGQMASITPGVGLYAFSALILVAVASYSAFDPDEFWEAVERLR